jgi:DNA-binding transcriptional ArsR family regulator
MDSQRAGAEMCGVRCIHGEEVRRARAHLAGEGAYSELAALFGALADATRARIVHALMHQELCTCDLAAVVGVSESGVSQHLRVLRSLRLVKSRRAGKFVYYTLDDAHVALLVSVGLAHQAHDGTTQGLGDLVLAAEGGKDHGSEA